MPKVGISLWGGMTASNVVECVKFAERRGFSSAWMAEGHGWDAFSILTACALSTKKIRLGTSIVSVFVRSAPTIALGAATVDAISEGRFILGLGSSHRVQVEPEHGLTYQKPMQRVRETVEIVRSLLRNGKISYKGNIYPQVDYDLWFTPIRKEVPIYVAAVFPKMLELCGQIAQGALMVWNTVGRTREAAEILRSAAEKSGRKASDVELASLLSTSISEDAEAAIRGMRQLVAFYAGFFPRYNRLISESGFAKEVKEIREAWLSGRKEEASAIVTEKMAKELSIVGEPEECIKRLREYRRAGLALPILFPTAPPKKAGKASGYHGLATVKDAVIAAIKAASP